MGPENESVTLAPLNVLIVEDDDDARATLQDILELESHNVYSVKTAQQAFARPEIFVNLEVMILDRRLPDGLAEELLPQFFRLAPNAKAIIVTGYADLDGTISAMRAGASDYIVKPINAAALLQRLASLAEQRRIKLQLAAERHFAKQILDTAEAIVMVLDQEGKIVRYNPFLTELTGLSLDRTRGRDWIEVFVPIGDRERMRSAFQPSLVDGGQRGIIGHVLDARGKELSIRWSVTPLQPGIDLPDRISDDGKSNTGILAGDISTAGILAVGLDVSDLIHAQRDLVQAERLAAIGQTMTGLAHESRNALQRIRSSVDLLEGAVKDDPEAMKDLTKIDRATNDLRDLLEEVRDYAAPVVLEKENTSIARIWQRAWANIGIAKTATATLIETSTGDDLIRVDQRRMEQVFRNVFENALDACGSCGEIRVDCKGGVNSVTITVVDSGPGMPSNLREEAFRAFFTTKPKGTGLGLAIVERLVAAHDGWITADESELGARFTIQLPRSSMASPSLT